jgi:adenine phosphoribosyltransferase
MTYADVSAAEFVKAYVRDVPDFPKPGILFKDITPVLAHPRGLTTITEAFAGRFERADIDVVVGVESRGFLFGAPLAERLGVGFVPVRKPGKLPYKTKRIAYALEYGEGHLEIHEDAISRGARVVIVDDLLATGGTAKATGDLVKLHGGDVLAYAFVIELEFLDGRGKLGDARVESIVRY